MIATVICQVCGEAIATIDTENISTPLNGAMFLSPDPIHGAEPPWPQTADVTWEHLYCPYGNKTHRPFHEGDKIMTREMGIFNVPYAMPKRMQQAPLIEEPKQDPGHFRRKTSGRR